jgi:hypothetical protein
VASSIWRAVPALGVTVNEHLDPGAYARPLFSSLNVSASCGVGGAFGDCLRGVHQVSVSIRGCSGCLFVSETAQVELKSERVQDPAWIRPSVGLRQMSAESARSQGLTLVHISAQLERFLWCRECTSGSSRGCLGGVRGYRGLFGV